MNVDTEVTLTDGLRAWLNIAARCRGVVKFEGQTPAGIGRVAGSVPVAGAPLRALPAPALTWLEDGGYELRVSACVWAEHGGPLWVSSLWATWHVEAKFADGAGGWKWRPSEASARAAATALVGFPIPPPIVVDGYVSLTALWPLAVSIAADQRARELLHRLAVRLGAEKPTLEAMLVLPGGVVRNVGADAPTVRFARMVPEQYVAIEELEAALRPDTAPAAAATTSKKSASTRKKTP